VLLLEALELVAKVLAAAKVIYKQVVTRDVEVVVAPEVLVVVAVAIITVQTKAVLA
jgi:hypothetical protein